MPSSTSIQPSLTDVHVNRLLTNVSVAFMQDQANFVADQFAPVIPSQEKSNVYATYDRGYFNRNQMTKRAPGTESTGAGYAVDLTASYTCEVYAFHHDIPDQRRANADRPLDPDLEAQRLCTYQALINRENSFVTTYFAGGLWTSDWDGVASGENGTSTFRQWNDVASTPIENVRLACTTVQARTGFRPNMLVLGRQVYDILLDHPDLVGRIDRGQTGGTALVRRETMAALFEVDRILVMDAIQNTAKEGQTNAHSFIGGKKALVAYVTPTASLMTPTAAYTFAWTGYAGNSALGTQIQRFRMQELKSDRVEIESAYVHKLISADLGAFFDTIVA